MRWGGATVCLRREILKAILGRLGESRTRDTVPEKSRVLGEEKEVVPFPKVEVLLCREELAKARRVPGSWVGLGISIPVCRNLGVTQGEKLPLLSAGAGGFRGEIPKARCPGPIVGF